MAKASRTKRKKPAAAGASTVDWIIRRANQTYRRRNWAGPGALPAMRGVTAQVAHWRPHAKQHSIAEMALHMAYWKDCVTAYLSGKPWKYEAAQNWRTVDATDAGWQQAQTELAAAHRRLMQALRTLTPGRLHKPGRGRDKVIDLAVDVATHDTYHAAQIFILRHHAEASAVGSIASS